MPSLRFAPYREIASEIATRLLAAREGRDPLAPWEEEVIVPSRGVSEAIAAELLTRLPHGVAGLQLQSLDEFARRVLAIPTSNNIQTPRVASDQERRLAMRIAIRSIDDVMMSSRGVAAMLERSYRDVRDSGFTLADFTRRAGNLRGLRNARRTELVIRAWTEYERLITQLGAIDPADLLSRATRVVDTRVKPQLLAGFYDMTGAQRQLAEALLRAERVPAIWVPSEAPFAEPFVGAIGAYAEIVRDPVLEIRRPQSDATAYNTRLDELRDVCSRVARLLAEGTPAREIGIVARSLEPYDAHLLNRFAAEHGFATTLREEVPLSAHRIGRGALTLLRLRDRGFPRAEVLGLLRDGLHTQTRLDVDPADAATRRARIAGGTSEELRRMRNRSPVIESYVALVAELEAMTANLDLNRLGSMFRIETETDLVAAEKLDAITTLFDRVKGWTAADVIDAIENDVIPSVDVIPSWGIGACANVEEMTTPHPPSAPSPLARGEGSRSSALSPRQLHRRGERVALSERSESKGRVRGELAMRVIRSGDVIPSGVEGPGRAGREDHDGRPTHPGPSTHARDDMPIWAGEVLRFRGRSFEHLFVLRMQDDVFPQRRTEDPLLPDSDRRLLGLREIGDGREEEQLLFSLLADATSTHVHFSFASGDGFGKVLRPSRFVRGVASGQLPVASKSQSRQLATGNRQLQLLVKAGTRSVFDGFIDPVALRKPLSPTQLEDFGECPQKFLLKHILGVQDVDHPERELQIHHRDKGTLDHRVLERFYKTLSEDQFRAPMSEELGQRLETFIDEQFDEHEREVPPFNRTVRDIERRATKRILREFVNRDLTDLEEHGLIPKWFEYRFGGKYAERANHPEPFVVEAGGVPVRVEGTIDRIDTSVGGWQLTVDGRTNDAAPPPTANRQPPTDRYRIVDYKSGKALRHVNLGDKIDRGVRLQLALYAMAVSEFFQAEPAAVSGTIKPLVSGEAKPATFAFTLEDKRATLLETLEIFIRAIGSGQFPAFPNANDAEFNSCKYCPVNHSCRTKHDADERYAVQQQKDPRTLLGGGAS